MAETPTRTGTAYLIPLAGPEMPPLELSPKPGGVVIGRHEQADLKLPADAEQVSRFHARFTCDGSLWRVSDLKSRWGTFLNGCRIGPGSDLPLHEGDLLRITPWTFSFSATKHRTGTDSLNDTHQMQTLVRTFSHETAHALADDMLALLLESAAGIHAAQDEASLAELVLDVACRGTGLSNAALLRPVDASGRVEIIASRFTSGTPSFSRSLLAAASGGVVAELSSADSANVAQSIVQMKINAAMCVPLMLGPAVAAYLYLDSRGNGPRSSALPANASAFCLALGRMAGLALANLKRIDMERRQAVMEAELSAGAEAQRWILPRRMSKLSAFTSIGESRPGRYVGGDFFDVVPLDEHRLAVALGDVSGKGIPASVLMTASQGFLHAALLEHGEPGRAVTDLNRFVHPRRPESKFITLWVGVFDAKEMTLSYVDAGHGYALLAKADGSFDSLASGEGLPVGIMEGATYAAETLKLPAGARALIVSDGIIEQFGTVTDRSGQSTQEQFQVERVRHALRGVTAGGDEIAALFQVLIDYAGTDHLADDATAVLVRW